MQILELAVRVTYRGTLIDVIGVQVDDMGGHKILSAALNDSVAIADFDQAPDDGEILISLQTEAGEEVHWERARFHRADAAEAIWRYLGIDIVETRKLISLRNLAAMYAMNRSIAQEGEKD